MDFEEMIKDVEAIQDMMAEKRSKMTEQEKDEAYLKSLKNLKKMCKNKKEVPNE